MVSPRRCSRAAAIFDLDPPVVANPRAMAAWGLIVAAGLVVGTIPLLVGLIVVMPILGHAIWHLYRRLVPR
jgi:uncharacterized membrane protein